MIPVKPITTCEFISMLQRCKPPTGWPGKLGMNQCTRSMIMLTTVPVSHCQLWWTGFYMPFVPLERHVTRNKRTQRKGRGVVRGIDLTERGPSIPSLLFRNVSRDLQSLSSSRYPSRLPANPLGLSPVRDQTFSWPILRTHRTGCEVYASALRYAPTRSRRDSVWSSRG